MLHGKGLTDFSHMYIFCGVAFDVDPAAIILRGLVLSVAAMV